MMIVRIVSWPSDDLSIIGKDVDRVLQYVLIVEPTVQNLYTEGFDVVRAVATESANLRGVQFPEVTTPNLTFEPVRRISAEDPCGDDVYIPTLAISGAEQRISIESIEGIECFGLAIQSAFSWEEPTETWANLQLEIDETSKPTGFIRIGAPVGATLEQLTELGNRATTIEAIQIDDVLFNAYSEHLAASMFDGRLERCTDAFYPPQNCEEFDLRTFGAGQ